MRVVTQDGAAGTGRHCSPSPFHGLLLLNKEVVGAPTGGPISQTTSPYTTLFLKILKDQIEIGIYPVIYRRTHTLTHLYQMAAE